MTFDEWYLAKHGATFEFQYMAPGMQIDASMKALLQAMCEYISDAVKNMLPPNAPQGEWTC